MAAKQFPPAPPDITFEEASQLLPKLLAQLHDCEPFNRNTIPKDILSSGVYVLYEGDVALYVGRSGRLKERIQEHGRGASSHYSASFAYNLAKRDAVLSKLNVNGKSRAVLCDDPTFKEMFANSKVRVGQMAVRCVAIPNQYIQVLFEVYAALELKASWNDFSPS